MRFIQFTFLFLLFGCFQPEKNNPEKIIRDEHFHHFLLINKYLPTDSSYTLNEEEIDQFIGKWNNSENVGMYKMMPEFWLSAYNSKGEVRSFRIRGNLIKEVGDITFSISDPNFFNNLWRKAKKIPPPPPLPPLLKKCDSIRKIAKKQYKNGVRKHTTFGLVYATDFEQYYSKYMKDNYEIIMRASCSEDYGDKCYYNSMNEEIEKEYGKNFIRETREKVKVEFEKVKK